MIIEFEPKMILASSPPQWWVYYREEYKTTFRKMALNFEQLKLFLETYGYETNDILELKQFGIETKQIKQNPKL